MYVHTHKSHIQVVSKREIVYLNFPMFRHFRGIQRVFTPAPTKTQFFNNISSISIAVDVFRMFVCFSFFHPKMSEGALHAGRSV